MSGPGALPRYIQISEMLLRDIAAGRLMPGEKLPAEREMAEGLGISVGTLRKALDVLENKGMLERVQGSGNYVREGHAPDGIYAFFRLELATGGGLPTAEVLSVATLEKPAHLPAFGTADRAHRIRRLRRLNGVPAALEEIWLDAAHAESLTAEALSESLYHFYKSRLGLLITRAEDRVGVAPVPGWGRDFPLAEGAAAGHVVRLSRDQDNAPAEVSETWFDPATVRYVARLR